MGELFDNFYYNNLLKEEDEEGVYLTFIFKSDNPHEFIEICTYTDECNYTKIHAHYYHQGIGAIWRINKKEAQRLLDKYENNYRIDLLML
jgi:hypothetical protein